MLDLYARSTSPALIIAQDLISDFVKEMEFASARKVGLAMAANVLSI
jgi:hypothetical protein